MKKVIEWIRVSTEAQAGDDRASIPAQRTDNRRTALAHGLEIVRSMEIVDVSGSSIMEAPEMHELLKLVEDPAIEGVVARDFSRLSRERISVTARILEHFEDNGVTLYTLDGAMNPAEFAGMLMGTFRGLMSHKERKDFLARVFASKEEKRRRGENPQSRATLPFGVGHTKERGWFYEPEAERVREAFRRFLAGDHTYKKLAEMVGVTPRGMHTIMRNPIWKGWKIYDQKRDPSPAGKYVSKDGRQADRRKIDRKPEDIIASQVIKVPLISAADWQRVQDVMDMKQERHWRSRPHESRFSYSGFLTCAKCGAPMQARNQRGDYYVCKNRLGGTCQARYLRCEKLEPVLDYLISEKLSDKNFLRERIRELNERANSSEHRRRVEALKADVARLEKKRSLVVDTYLEQVIDRIERDRRLATLDPELQARQRALRETEAEIPHPPSCEDVLVYAAEPWLHWHSDWTPKEKQKLLARLMPDFRVSDYLSADGDHRVFIEAVGLRLDVAEETRSRADITTIPRAIATAPNR